MIPFTVTFQIAKTCVLFHALDAIYLLVTNSATWSLTLTYNTRRWPMHPLHAPLVPTVGDHGVVTPSA